MYNRKTPGSCSASKYHMQKLPNVSKPRRRISYRGVSSSKLVAIINSDFAICTVLDDARWHAMLSLVGHGCLPASLIGTILIKGCLSACTVQTHSAHVLCSPSQDPEECPTFHVYALPRDKSHRLPGSQATAAASRQP